MSSAIEWTDATWNPIVGCSLASAGCTNCYAMNMAFRLERMGVQKYSNTTTKKNKKAVWSNYIFEDEKSLSIPLKWKKSKNIFVNSMGDLFHKNTTDKFLLKIWKVMKQTPQHNYQILTKRPERMRDFLVKYRIEKEKNIWLGTSVENMDNVYRISILREVAAQIKFISFEPLIGRIDNVDLAGIDWAIVGGESGPYARPIKEDWIDLIYDACQKSGTTFFFKQWGNWGQDKKFRSKKANGRLYKGQSWNGTPNLGSPTTTQSSYG